VAWELVDSTSSSTAPRRYTSASWLALVVATARSRVSLVIPKKPFTEMSDMATKTKTKTEKTPLTLNDRMDKIQEMVEMLNNDIFEGNITTNEITDQLEQISIKIDNFKDLL
jgi:hypothetical protein